MSIDLSPAFFDLQLRFADQIARVSNLSFEEALFSFTNTYFQCLSQPFDPTYLAWQVYLEELRRTPDKASWTFTFYENRREAAAPSAYSCFQYVYLADKQVIRLHFTNVDSSGHGPLSKERRTTRLHELKTLFAEVKTQYPDAQRVEGASWLYNIEAYKRLFPSKYTHAMERRDEEFQYLALWGQFLLRDGCVRQAYVNFFLSCCSQQQTFEGVIRCFPYQVLAPSCSITSFYEFYLQDERSEESIQ